MPTKGIGAVSYRLFLYFEHAQALELPHCTHCCDANSASLRRFATAAPRTGMSPTLWRLSMRRRLGRVTASAAVSASSVHISRHRFNSASAS